MTCSLIHLTYPSHLIKQNEFSEWMNDFRYSLKLYATMTVSESPRVSIGAFIKDIKEPFINSQMNHWTNCLFHPLS